MKHDMEHGMRYIVIKDSNDGTFVVGDKVELLHDNAVGNWTVGGWIDAVDVPEATAGMEVEIVFCFNIEGATKLLSLLTCKGIVTDRISCQF